MTKLGDIPLYREVSAYDVVEQLTFDATAEAQGGPWPAHKPMIPPRSGTMLVIGAGTSFGTGGGIHQGSCYPSRGTAGTYPPTRYENFGSLYFNLSSSHELHNNNGVLVTTAPGDELVSWWFSYMIFQGTGNVDDYFGACAIVAEDGRSTTP